MNKRTFLAVWCSKQVSPLICLRWLGYVGLGMVVAGCAKEPSTYQGYMEGEFVYFSAPYAGRLAKLPVARGQRVTNGTLLFSIDPAEAEYLKQKDYNQWQSSVNQLKDLSTGKRPSEIALLNAQLAQIQAETSRSRQQLARDEQAYGIQAISLEKLEASRATVKVNEEKVAEISSQLVTAKLPSRPHVLLSQEAKVAAQRAEFMRSDWQYRQRDVESVGPSRVVDTLFRVGEWVPAGSPVVKIFPDEALKVRFFLPEALLAKVALGQKVSIRCDGCKKDYQASINYIAPEAEYTPPVIYSESARSKLVFMLEAVPDKGDENVLHPGLPVEIAL